MEDGRERWKLLAIDEEEYERTFARKDDVMRWL